MKKLFKALFLSVFIVLAMSCIQVFGLELISVYLNGQVLAYDDVQPQIINNRVMVPIRKTADYLGYTTDWNSTTETMTFTKGNRKIVHVMRSNVIYVDGQAITFDTPSQNIQNRTVMPVRMLAEATGANVDWDNAARRVIITTNSPKVVNVTTSKSVAAVGETVTFTVTANGDTDRVKIIDTVDNSLINESSTYTTNADGSRVFTLPWVPYSTTGQTKVLKAYAGSATAYNDSADSTLSAVVNVSVSEKPKVKNYYVDDTSVDKNDYVNVTIYTNSAADRVKVRSSFVSGDVEYKNYSKSGDDKIFDFRIKMTKSGKQTLDIYAGNSSGYSTDYQTIKVDVDTKSGSSDDDELEINKIKVSDEYANVGDEVTITVTTTYDIEQVKIYDSDDHVMVRSTSPDSKSKNDNEKTWKLKFDIEDSGNNKYYVYAYDDDKDEVYDSFRIRSDSDSNSSSSGDLSIKSVTQMKSSVEVGDSVKFEVKTSDKAEYIKIFDYDNSLVEGPIKTFTSSSSNRIFEFTVTAPKESKNKFYVRAYDSKDNNVEKRISIDLDDSAGDPKINDIDYDDEVDEDDYAEITVHTNKAVQKVTIEDSDDDEVDKLRKPTRTKDDEKIWEFSIKMRDSGRQRFNIIAENDDGDTDEDTITIRVY